MIDVPTIQGWVDKLGFTSVVEGRTTLALQQKPGEGQAKLPPFFIQCSEHWVLLSMLPMLTADEWRPDDLGRRLLAANREMRVVKFAIDQNGEIVLCAELPTESLDCSELADAVARVVQYARLFQVEVMRRPT